MSLREPPQAIFLSPVVPSPSGGGREMRAWAWLTELSRTHRVHLVVVVGGSQTLPADPRGLPVTSLFALQPGRLRLSPYRRPWAALEATSGCAGGTGFPDWRAVDAAAARLLRRLAQTHAERVLVFRLYLHNYAAALRRHFTSARFELDLDDVESATRASLARLWLRHARPLKAWLAWTSARAFRRLESSVLPSYDRVWLACAEDAEYLPPQVRAAHFPSRLPRPAAPTLAQSTPSSKEPGCLLFVGSLGYLPNIDAALFLAREVAPRLRRLHAGRWRILILGRGAPRSLVRRLRATPEIEVVGEVADLAPYYRRCQAALVPLRGGGGTKIKTIEAFANNCPVVSTAEGVRGLVVRPGLDYLQADDADAVAQACARLRACPALAQELTRNASELFARRYALEDGAAPRSCGPCSPPEYPGRAGEQTS